MPYKCSCGEEFRTLTRKRIHQEDDCPLHDRIVEDLDGLDIDEIAERTAAGLLECVNCGETTDGIFDIMRQFGDDELELTVRFVCTHCGVENSNNAVLS